MMKSPPETLIKPIEGWVALDLKELWNYRFMLYFLVLRNIKAAYQQSILGPTWVVINSVITVIIYSFIFGEVAKLPSEGIPYPLFTYTGVMIWTLLSNNIAVTTVSMSQNMIYKKVYFPRLTIPLVAIADNIVNFGLALVVLIFMLVGYGYTPSPWMLVGIPYFFLISAILGLGVGLFFVPFDVRFRDTRHLVGYMNRLLFYAAPVVYAKSILSEPFLTLINLSPITVIIEGYRWSIVGGTPPAIGSVMMVSFLSLVILYGGLLFFRRNEKYFADLS